MDKFSKPIQRYVYASVCIICQDYASYAKENKSMSIHTSRSNSHISAIMVRVYWHTLISTILCVINVQGLCRKINIIMYRLCILYNLGV